MRAIFFFAILFATAVHADEHVKIPLKDIWAYYMPGTTEVSEKEVTPENVNEADLARLHRESLVTQIRLQLGRRKLGQQADSGFCVAGSGLDALKAAHSVIVNSKTPQTAFPFGTEITLVFFSHNAGKYVHLVDVERTGTTIEVQYRFEPHLDRLVTAHFALIPLGKLNPGKYNVTPVQLPIQPGHDESGQTVSKDLVGQLISKPFTFLVTEK